MPGSLLGSVRTFLLGAARPTVRVNQESFRSVDTLKRVDPLELEILYARDTVIFNSVNVWVELFMAGRQRIRGRTDADQEVIDEWTSHFNLTHVLKKIALCRYVYGNGWVEKVQALHEKKQKIWALDWIDPKAMDFKRDHQNRILYDRLGKPVGYVQYFAYGDLSEEELKGRKVVSQNGKQAIEIPRELVAHFPMFTVGDSLNGIGLVEPLYNVTKLKMNIEEGLGQYTYRKGYPMFVVYVGDERHEPRMEEVDSIADKVQNISYKNELVMPYYNKVEILESKSAEKKQDQLEYFVNQQLNGLGMPKPIATGSGEATNRATLRDQMKVLMRKVQQDQQEVAHVFKQRILTELARDWELSAVPELVFQSLEAEDLTDRAARLKSYVEARLLTPDRSIERVIRESENLPAEEDHEADEAQQAEPAA